MLPDLQLGDMLRLRKVHPCGSYEWKVVRLGADIGLECQGCGRRVMLPRRQLAHRVKTMTHVPGNPIPGKFSIEGTIPTSDDSESS